jgi:hypothetical protein
MSRIKLNLKQLSATEKIAKAKRIVTALTGSADFTTPTPGLASITSAINAYEAATTATQAARQEVKSSFSDQVVKEDELDQLLKQLAAYVESVAGTNDSLIQSVGMDTRLAAAAPTKLLPPTGLSASAGDNDGEIDLSWEKVAKAKSYLIEKCADPPTAAGWVHAGAATRTAATVSGLSSSSRYWFRVAGVGAFGPSGWSDPATRIVP